MGVLDYIVGRQPIFDKTSDVIGYELVFRGRAQGEWSTSYAPDQVLSVEALYAALPQELDGLVGNKRVFCSATRDLLQGKATLSLPPERTVIEIPSSRPPDDFVLQRSRELLRAGYTIAMENLVRTDGFGDMFILANLARVDTSAVDPATAARIVEECHTERIQVIAAGVDLQQQFQECVMMGFDYFQGYFLAMPQFVPGRTLTPSRTARLRLAAKLLSQEAKISELEQIVEMDPAMTTQLLELAGLGAAGGMRRVIKSLHEAIVIVGWRRLQSWLALLLTADRNDTSEEAVQNALLRARICQILAEQVNPRLRDEAFTAGMLSTLDLLLGMPLYSALKDLPIHPELEAAVLLHQGLVGAIVADATNIQVGKYDQARLSGIPTNQLQQAYTAALSWLNETFAGGTFMNPPAPPGDGGPDARAGSAW